jgi:hypothetical protein
MPQVGHAEEAHWWRSSEAVSGFGVQSLAQLDGSAPCWRQRSKQTHAKEHAVFSQQPVSSAQHDVARQPSHGSALGAHAFGTPQTPLKQAPVQQSPPPQGAPSGRQPGPGALLQTPFVQL